MILLHPNTLSHPRLGVTVSRKVGNAVARGHVRRRVREVFRQHKDWFPAGWDVVVIAKRRAAQATFQEALTDLRGARSRMRSIASQDAP